MRNMSDLLDGLNEPQKQAVLHGLGPMIVLAGPGSGKTATVTRRIARLIREKEVDPSRILGVTFTNKAATEMRERVEKLLGRKAYGLWLCTFHAAAARILRKVVGQFPFGRTSTFEIIDQSTQTKEMKAVIQHDLKLDEKEYKAPTFLSALQEAKAHGILPTDYEYRGQLAPLYRKAAAFYEARLRVLNAFDFGDLLLYVTQALDQDKDLREEWSRTFQYILVDEYQDTCPVQLLFLDLLTSTHKNISVVGDDAQCIFGFTFANLHTILDFARDYPGAKEVRLEQNYRSTPEIVEASNMLIENNRVRYDKTCFTANASGPGITVVVHDGEKQESWWAVAECMKRHREGVPWGEMFVLYRTNSQSRVLEEAFVGKGIPYNVKGAFKFYDREEIQDLLGYLKVLSNPANRIAWERIANKPTRGLGASTVQAIVEYAQEHSLTFRAALNDSHYLFKGVTQKKVAAFTAQMQRLEIFAEGAKVSSLLQTIIDGIDFKAWLLGKGDTTSAAADRWQNVLELVRAVEMYENDTPPDEASLLGFLERVALVTQEDEAAARDKDKVLLTTLHSCKGLEAQVVIITGVEQGLIPHFNAMHDPAQSEEERRLFYVGMTRAKRFLYLSRARSRWLHGKPMDGRPSQFIRELALDNSR